LWSSENPKPETIRNGVIFLSEWATDTAHNLIFLTKCRKHKNETKVFDTM
jgi:hypothetical protein